jgi:hypothetical protein
MGLSIAASFQAEMNDPPTAVGGIKSFAFARSRLEINDPLTPVSGFCAKPRADKTNSNIMNESLR